MRKLKLLSAIITAALLSACSGGSDNTLTLDGALLPGAPLPADVATVTLLTSNPQIPSDGTADATITALVRDSDNTVMADVAVIFNANSGSLVVNQPIVTNASGVVTATLSTAGDPTNRIITVTATATAATGGTPIQDTVDVNVVGTSLVINGPPSLPLGDTGTYNVVLTDAGGNGIANTLVDITSATGNGISQSPLLTDAAGQASFVLSANAAGADTLNADALGLQAVKDVDVSADVFAFTAPPAETEIDLGADQDVTVNWQTGGGPVVGGQVTFTTTRGALVPVDGVAITDGSGNATVTVSATNAGPAVITATNADDTSTQLGVEFIATTPATLELQADPFTVATTEQSAITAIVRDANGNLVKNQTVSFVLTDVTGGFLSVAQAVTNSQGRAQTFYTASSTTSQVDGVQIDATVQGAPLVTDLVNLTVAQREVFISIGTGNEIFEPNTAQYRKEWVVQVTGIDGVGVDLVEVTFSILSEKYWDGRRAYVNPPGSWQTIRGDQALPLEGCEDEDINNRNGILDGGPGGPEDRNGNGEIEAGNIATAVAQPTYGEGNTLTTDVNGFGVIDVYWPQEYAYWMDVTLEARTSVQGTEFAASTTFALPGLAEDFTNENIGPPGEDSPFGTDGFCATPPPPDGP